MNGVKCTSLLLIRARDWNWQEYELKSKVPRNKSRSYSRILALKTSAVAALYAVVAERDFMVCSSFMPKTCSRGCCVRGAAAVAAFTSAVAEEDFWSCQSSLPQAYSRSGRDRWKGQRSLPTAILRSRFKYLFLEIGRASCRERV